MADQVLIPMGILEMNFERILGGTPKNFLSSSHSIMLWPLDTLKCICPNCLPNLNSLIFRWKKLHWASVVREYINVCPCDIQYITNRVNRKKLNNCWSAAFQLILRGILRGDTVSTLNSLFLPDMGLLGSQAITRKKQLWIMSYFWALFFLTFHGQKKSYFF